MKQIEIKKLDKLCSEIVKKEAKNKCELCGKSDKCRLNCHHFIGRRHRSLRWWLPNLICLCSSCHTMSLWSAHENPDWFRGKMLDIKGNKWLKELRQRENKVFKGTYQQVLDYLENKNWDYID